MLTTITPPTVTWSGTDVATSDDWSDPLNWVGGAAPVAGDTVIFHRPDRRAALTSNNDIPNTTFSSLTIADQGSAATGDGIGLAGSIDASQATGSSTVALPITFNPGTSTVTVDNAGATLDLSGVVAATSGLTKQGLGSLALAANDGTMAVAVAGGTPRLTAPWVPSRPVRARPWGALAPSPRSRPPRQPSARVTPRRPRAC